MADQLSTGLWYPTEPEPELDDTLDKTVWVICPHCKGQGVMIIAAVTAGEPQPEEIMPCELCDGDGEVAESTAALYNTEGLDAVLIARHLAELPILGAPIPNADNPAWEPTDDVF